MSTPERERYDELCPRCGAELVAGMVISGNADTGESPDYTEYCVTPDCGFWEYV